MNRGGRISVSPKKVGAGRSDPYETVFSPLPRCLVDEFVKEMKRQGREEFVVYGCYPAMDGEECLMLMADWIGDSKLLREDMGFISGLHSDWIRRMVAGPKADAGESPQRKGRGMTKSRRRSL